MKTVPVAPKSASSISYLVQLPCFKYRRIPRILCLLIVITCLLRQTAQAQDELFDCNLPTPFVDNTSFNVSIVSGTMPESNILNIQRWTGAFGANVGAVNNSGNAIDANLDNAASMTYVLSVSGGQRLTIQSDNETIPAGYFAGFAIKNASILDVSVLGSYTIKTYLGNTFQEGVNGNSGSLAAKLLNDNGINQIGFVTTKPFNRIMIEQNQALGIALGTTEIYYAVIQKFCAESQPRPCNELEYWTNPGFPVYVNQSNTGIDPSVVCANCQVQNINRLVDNDTANYAEIALAGSLGASGSISVKNTQTIYPAGTFAGFDINDVRVLGVAVGSTHTISTYLNGELQESIADGGALADGGIFTSTGRMITGFKTAKDFDEIQFSIHNLVAVGANPVRIYGAVVKRFCAGPALSCNVNTKMTENIYPVFVDAKHTGIDALACLQCDIREASNAIDNDPDNYTQVVIPVGAATTATYAVADGYTVYNTNPAQKVFAGFDIENPNLIGADVLSGLSIVTTLNGVVRQTADMSSGLISANASLLNGSGRQTVGFLPSISFDGIKIVFNSAVKANIGTTRIYNAVFKQFCESELPCNVLTGVQNPGQPVYVNGVRTQIDAVGCIGCQLNNAENIVDASATLPATLVMGAGIGAKASIAVANAIGTYPAESFAGFEIESASLLSADLLAAINITLYNKGVEVQSGAGQSLLAGVNSSIITGGPNRQIVGIISRTDFDEAQLNIQNLAGVNLGEILIYKAHVQKSCALNIDCNTNKLLNSAEDGAVIDAAHTGVKGGVCVGCLVNGPWDAVSENNADYSRLYNTASALITNSLAVAAPAYTFPAGTFAGFTIKKNNFIVAAGLFPAIVITTYNDGIAQESKTGGSLIDLAILTQWLGTPNSIYTPGFYTSKPFDEIKITVGSLVAALDQYIDVYGAYVDVSRQTVGAGLNCNSSNPDFNVAFINVSVEGNVATNDNVQPGSIYGAVIDVPTGITNPSSALPVIHPDGSYTFIATAPGVHQFEVSICPSVTSMNCPKELLTITVQDSTPGSRNPPIANTDLAIAPFNTTVVINSLHNDKLGSPGFALAPSSVTLIDLNGEGQGNTSSGGSAVANPATGEVSYTPPLDFVGIDTIRYSVCDNQPEPQCASAYQIVEVYPPLAANATKASDDFVTSAKNGVIAMSVAKGVLTNDKDPEGDSISAIPKDTTIAGQGRLQLYADGSYIFTPVQDFTGTVAIPYTIQDDGIPMATASATIYLLIKSGPDLSPVITVLPASIHGTTNITVVIDVTEINNISSSGQTTVNLIKNRLISLVFDPLVTSIDGKAVQNSKWTFDAVSNSSYYILKTNETIPAGGVLSFGFTGTLTPGATDGKINMTTIVMPGSGKEENLANNLDVEPIYFYEY